jgi:hypothetical protein
MYYVFITVNYLPLICNIRNRMLHTGIKLESQVSVFISPRNRVSQLCPQTLGSLLVVSYESQGYGGGIITRLHARVFVVLVDITTDGQLTCLPPRVEAG